MLAAPMQDLPSSHRLTAARRKNLGAFYTPPELTDFAVAWAITGRAAKVLDPGCGDAAFLCSAAARLKLLGADPHAIASQLGGIDLNTDAIETAAGELAKIGTPRPTLIHSDFFQVSATAREGKRVAGVDALIGNPPYVRYQLFRDESREAGLRAALRAGVLLPQLSSSWAPYIVHASTFLKPEGRVALVLPGELLHVGYAAAVREFLLRSYRELTIITFEEKVFPGALEEVVVILGVKAPGMGDGKLRVCRLTSLRDLEAGPEAVLAAGRVTTPAPGERWLTALLEEEAVSGSLEALERAGFRTLGDLGRVDIGAVTGANEYFVMSRKEALENGLPMSVLMPVISKAAHVQGSRFTEAEWKERLAAGEPMFMLVAGEADARGSVARYIKKGEEMGLPARYKCRTRKPWYAVPYVRTPDLFLTYMSHVAPRLVVNEARATNTNTVHGVFLSDPALAAPLAAAFLSSATLLSAEIEGRSYGGGVLKMEPREALKLRVPDLSPRLIERLTAILPEIDALVRAQRTDEASAAVDRIVLGDVMSEREVSSIRESLMSLRTRRMVRGRGVVKASPAIPSGEQAPAAVATPTKSLRAAPARGPRRA
ncbi:MAG TPA: class I SAM-dependent methyltransferase [Polyangiaceae bacterium]|nr:class I SAM-dependent methyltransferase [Polyangiaceae bacterium]